MIKLNHDVLLKLNETDFIETDIKIVSNDSLTHFITIKVVDDFLNEINYSQVNNAIIIFAKQDGKVVQGNLTKTQYGYTYTMGTNEIAVPGIVIACVQLLGSTGERLTTSRFKFNVIGDLLNDSAVESTTEFAMLQALKQELESIDVVNLTNTVSVHLTDIAAHGINTKVLKNWIINGGFDVWQRGTSQSASGYGSDDRWKSDHIGSTKTHSRQAFTVGQTEVPNNPTYFSRTIVNSVAGVSNFVAKFQKVEDVTKLAGKIITLSFWAKADTAKNIAFDFVQNFGTGGSANVEGIGSTKIPITASWAKYTVTATIPSVLGKTIGTGSSLFAVFWFDAGSNYNARTNSLGQQNGTFDIANVSLVEGSNAQEWQTEKFDDVLRACQRYYEVIDALNCYLYCDGSPRSLNFNFKATKRVAPTCKVYDGMGNENKITFITSGYVAEHNKPLYGDVPVTSLSTATISFIPSAGYINVGFTKFTADAEL